MNNDEAVWVDCPKWHDRWEVLENLPGGGQGESFRARLKVDGRVTFLKTIRAKTDPERRARFFREASAYDTFRIERVPRLIESNAHRHKNPEFEPYLATEFVEGPTLRKWREKQQRVDLSIAVATTRSLLTVLKECHAKGCMHRDIKPDNIILANSDPPQIALLDFGLSYHLTPELVFQTEHGQEIGNRFLRLPELAAGSFLKQDPRSDISFAAGILFYLLTGLHPDVLQDAEGRLPQRSQAVTIIQDVGGTRYGPLASLFDRGFATRISERFANVDAMLLLIDALTEGQDATHSPDDDLQAILAITDSWEEPGSAAITERIRDAFQRVVQVCKQVEAELRGRLALGQPNLRITADVGSETFLWFRPVSGERMMSTTCEVREIGNEIVIRLFGETVFRTPSLSPDFGEQFRSAIRIRLLAQIRETLSDPNPLPPEARNFGEIEPLARLDKAIAKARQTGRRIIAFVYDPRQPGNGQLQYGLQYFLQNKKTRDAIRDAFIVALVPLSDVSARSNVLEGQSMESSRWVVLDADLTVLRQGHVNVNPQDAESMAIDLAKRYGTT